MDRSGHRVLGVVGSYREDGGTGRGHVLDLSDPYHPVRIAATEACGSGALVLPGGSLGLVYGSRCATLFDLETGARRAELGANAVSAAAAVVDGSSRLFLVHHEVSPPGPARYRAWDVSNPKSPVLLFSGEAERRAEVLADKRGEILVVAGYQAITVLDAGDGMPLSTIALSSVRRNVALSDAGGVRMLAVSHDEDVDLYDLGNPAHSCCTWKSRRPTSRTLRSASRSTTRGCIGSSSVAS